MGYSTEYYGSFNVTPAMDGEMIDYLRRFSETRRMQRDNDAIMGNFPDWADDCLDGELGEQGEFFVGGAGYMGQERDPSVVDYNCPPETQPSLWCQWVPTDDGSGIVWDGGKKFYEADRWIEYIANSILAPAGYDVEGKLEWSDDYGDSGTLAFEDGRAIVDYS